MCALYVRCTLSALQKECRKVWGARYTLGAHYQSENTVHTSLLHRFIAVHNLVLLLLHFAAFLLAKSRSWICDISQNKTVSSGHL